MDPRAEWLRREIKARKAAIRWNRDRLHRLTAELAALDAKRLGLGVKVVTAKGEEIPWPKCSTSTS